MNKLNNFLGLVPLFLLLVAVHASPSLPDKIEDLLTPAQVYLTIMQGVNQTNVFIKSLKDKEE